MPFAASWRQGGVSKISFHNVAEGVSKCDFAMSRDVACRVSMFATTYKTFNINSLRKILRLYCHIEMIILIHPQSDWLNINVLC